MSIYQTTRGRGVDIRDEYGRRRRFHVGDQGAARALEAHLTADVHQKKLKLGHLTAAPLPLVAAVDLWLARRTVAASTKTADLWRLRSLSKLCGGQPVMEITPALLSTWHQARRSEVSQVTLACEVRVIRRLFQFLEGETYMHSDPTRDLPKEAPHLQPGRALTYEEEAKLLETADRRTRIRLLLALDAGLRRSEIRILRRNHVDLEQKLLTVYSTKTNTTRVLPLTARLHAALTEHVSTLTYPDALLIQQNAQVVKNLTWFLYTLHRKTGVRVRFHDLRHTFASRLSTAAHAARLKYAVVRQALGHTARTTTEIYDHASPEEVRAAVLAMERANPNSPTQEQTT